MTGYPWTTGQTLTAADLNAEFLALTEQSPEVFSVKEYGAVGNGIADDTAAIRAAIAAAVAAGRGNVYLPPGNYLVSSTLTATVPGGMKFCGAGAQVSIVTPTNLSTDLFAMVSATLSPVEMCDFSVVYTQTTTGGTIFNFAGGAGGLHLHDIDTVNGFNVLQLGGGTLAQSFTVDRMFMIGFLNNGITVDLGVGGLGFVSNIIMSCSTSNAVGYGISFKSGQSVSFDMMQIQGMASPIVIAATTSNIITDCTFSNCYADNAARGQTGGPGWTIDNAAGLTRRIRLTQCWAGACGSAGFNLVGVDSVNLVNCIAIANVADGFTLQPGCTNITLNGCEAYSNSFLSHGTYNGISVDATCTNFSITGCRSGTCADFPTATQGYGIAVGGGASNEYIIALNRLGGNTIAGLVDGGTGSTKQVSLNLLT